MLFAPPEATGVAAARWDLGRGEATYRNWRADPFRTAWLAVGAAIVLAVPLFLLGLPLLGALLVPLAAIGAVAYAVLPRPAGGRRWLVLHERGFVDVVDGNPPLVARWEWVAGPVESAPDGSRAITVAPDGPAGPARVVLDGLRPPADLVAAVDRHVQPLMLAGDVAARSAHAGAVRNRRGRYLGSVAGLVVLALLPGVGYAAIGGPDDAPTPAARSRPTPSPTPAARMPSWPGPAPTSAAPPPYLPDTIYGYSSLCDDGRGFTGAARYGGRAPHPIHVDENFVQGPARWYSEDPAKIQIVACVQLGKGRVLRKCRYFGDGKDVVQDMVLGRYTLTIREARTAKVVGRTRIDGAEANCLGLLYGSREPGEQQVSVPTKAQIQNALRRYTE